LPEYVTELMKRSAKHPRKNYFAWEGAIV